MLMPLIFLLFLSLISFLMFPCASVWENARTWVPHFLVILTGTCSYRETRWSEMRWSEDSRVKTNYNNNNNNNDNNNNIRLVIWRSTSSFETLGWLLAYIGGLGCVWCSIVCSVLSLILLRLANIDPASGCSTEIFIHIVLSGFGDLFFRYF